MKLFENNNNADEDFSLYTPFEPLYQYIKTDKNKVWEIYQIKVDQLLGWLSWMKNFDRSELLQQSYIYFCALCDAYFPYYEGRFYKFDRYLFKNLIMKLRAYIQRYYFKGSREKPSEFCEYLTSSNVTNPIKEFEGNMYVNYLLSLLTDKSREVIQLTLEGYKQQEIGAKLHISQSRVSVIKKQAFKELMIIANENYTDDDKQKIRLEELREYFYGKLTPKGK